MLNWGESGALAYLIEYCSDDWWDSGRGYTYTARW